VGHTHTPSPQHDILAVVLGSAINQDGRSSGLTAPNGPSQQAVIRLALHDAGLEACGVHTLEMHGTGTPLGDPIEVGAAAAVFVASIGKAAPQVAGMRPGPLELSAAKSQMGHTEPAAGATGLCRAVFRLGAGCALGMLHLSSVNPYVADTLSGHSARHVFLPRGPSPAATTGAESGAVGVSGFAFQGTNAHVVVGRWAGGYVSYIYIYMCVCICMYIHHSCKFNAVHGYFGVPTQDFCCLTLCIAKLCRMLGMELPCPATRAAQFAWERRPYWFAPPPHRFVSSHLGTDSSSCLFECDLHHAAMSFLHEHAVNGRSILPGMAMLEVAHAATATAILGEADHPHALSASLMEACGWYLLLPRYC
jgi:hypothetical protein